MQLDMYSLLSLVFCYLGKIRSSVRRDKLHPHKYKYFSHVAIYLSERKLEMS